MKEIDDIVSTILQTCSIGVKLLFIILFIVLSAVIVFIIKMALPITNRNINKIEDLKYKRKSIRKQNHISVLLSSDEEFNDVEKTFTLNTSQTGCFICTEGNWETDDIVWIKYVNNNRIRLGKICRIQALSDSQLPGIGIEFV